MFPELFLSYKGVDIYRAYNDHGQLTQFWFSTDPSDVNADYPWVHLFDIRQLASEMKIELGSKVSLVAYQNLIKKAIENDVISSAGPRVARVPTSIPFKVEFTGG